MAEFTLYCFAESGNAYKVALMLELCGADWEPRGVEFFKGETRSEEYRAVNVMGEAPILVHHRADGDFTLSQSGAILTYLSRRLGRFGHESEAEEYEILRWVLYDNHKLTSYTATERFMRHFRGKAGDPTAEFIYARAKDAWKVLDTHLEGREWVAAARPTIADISMCGYLFWPDQIGADWNEYPAIAAWLDRIRNLDGWAAPEALMPSGQ
ncbi:glutathione S-transferase family protein [Mesorhizobium xinjiangense]|uniref:glutathione S-transferase family protein n=1 Tax=Mesorhizobium xinjiangense TaxID=2678685 RepID=UPI0012ECEA75|nr:glutathione S-transferase [Mesorhizobium xinjiangense]